MFNLWELLFVRNLIMSEGNGSRISENNRN